MKKVLIFAFIISVSTTSAQSLEKFKFGFTTFDGNNCFVEYALTQRLGLQSGLGSKIHSTASIFINGMYPLVGGQVFEYLRLPIMARYYFPFSPGLCLSGGISFYYLLSAMSYPPSSIEGTNLFNLPKDKKPINYNIGIHLGLDYETSFGLIFGITLCEWVIFTPTQHPKPINYTYSSLVLGYNLAKLLKKNTWF